MTKLQRSAAICGALLALPVAAVVAFRASSPKATLPEVKALEPSAAEVAAVVEQPVPAVLRRTPDHVGRVAPAPPAVKVPTPENEIETAVFADERASETVGSGPGDIDRPVHLDLGVMARAKEDPPPPRP
jgi:hypothetical protein